MSSKKYPGIVFVLIAIILLSACSKDDELKTRPFRMGFIPLSYETSMEGVGYTYAKIATEGDIINHHFDTGVPWNEALNGTRFSQDLIDDWALRKAKSSANQKIYVSVTPINKRRNGLAAYRGIEDTMPLPARWNTYAFNDDNVKTAYLNYCKRVIAFFEPDYFGMSIEANLLYVMNPDLWTDYLELHRFVYTQLKIAYPEMPVFTSVAGEPVLKGFVEGNDHVQQRLAVMQLMENSDYYAISFYPHLSSYHGNPYPENTFDELFSISTKPIIVAETGYTAETFTINNGKGTVTVETDPVKQQQYLDDLLVACEKWKAEFVIYFTLRDYDERWTGVSLPKDMSIAWRDAGLYDEKGNPRPALNAWREWFKKRVGD